MVKGGDRKCTRYVICLRRRYTGCYNYSGLLFRPRFLLRSWKFNSPVTADGQRKLRGDLTLTAIFVAHVGKRIASRLVTDTGPGRADNIELFAGWVQKIVDEGVT